MSRPPSTTVVELTRIRDNDCRSNKDPLFKLRYVRLPYNETYGPFETECLHLTSDDLAERRAVDAIHSSWLSKNPQASIHCNVLNEILGDKAQYSDRQQLTTGKFDAEWHVSMSYHLGQGFSEPTFGRMKFPHRDWQRLDNMGIKAGVRVPV
jgi:hypothetical protein